MTYSNYYYPTRDVYYAAEYVRISREDGDKLESDSIESQRILINQYAENHKEIKIVEEYKDDGYTGTNFERPGFKKMIKDIESGLINCVIVKDLSRFGRDYIDVGNYLERYFPNKDIRFIAINDNVDSYSPGYDDMYMPVKNFFNSQYPKDISKKVQSSFKAKQTSGQFIGAFSSYGYLKSPKDKHKLIIDEYAATIVRRIFEMYANGLGKIRIAKILNDEEILCPSEYKKSIGLNYSNCNKIQTTHYWTYPTINSILHNEMYIGNMVQSKTVRRMHGKPKKLPKDRWIIVKGTHEPIIPKSLWDNVQILLKKNTIDIDFQNNISVLAGFIKCGDCGRAMAKSNRRKDGISAVSYSCGSYKRYGKKICSSHYINEKTIINAILSVMNDSIAKVKNIQAIMNSVKKKNNVDFCAIVSRLDSLNAEIKNVKEKIMSLYDDYKDELLSKEEYIALRKKYQSKEKQLSEQVSLLKAKSNDNTKGAELPPVIQKLLKYKKITAEDIDREFMASFIDEVLIFENRKIELKLNFFLPDVQNQS